MTNEKTKNWQKAISLSLVVFGTLGYILTLNPSIGVGLLGLFRELSYFIVPFGLGWYARTKGRSIAWGFLGLLPLFGALAALITLELRIKPPVTTSGAWGNKIGFIVLIGFILMYFLTHLPGYIAYTKRSRTSEALDHAQYLCTAVSDLTSVAAGDGKGEAKPKSLKVSLEGVQWALKYTEAVMKNGDPYQFNVHVDGTHGSSADNPVVLASTKDGEGESRVYAEIIQVGGTGVVSGDDLAGCKRNVEKVSDGY